MERREHNRKRRFLTKTVCVFLVFLYCAFIPKTAGAAVFDNIETWLAQGAQVAADEMTSPFFSLASLASAWQGFTCFFGVDCPAPPEEQTASGDSSRDSAGDKAQTVSTQTPPDLSQSSVDVLTVARQNKPDTVLIPEYEVITAPNQTVQNIYNTYNPVTEVKETRTVVEIDEDTKDKVKMLLRQLDTDRGNYSVGQDFTMPDKITGETFATDSDDFSVDKDGNVAAQNITAVGNFTVRGGFTVSGSSPAIGKVLTSDADGLATWQTPAEGVTIHNLLSGLDYSSSGHTGFEPAVTKGNLTEIGSDILTITGGTGAVIGSGASVQVRQAGAAHSGYLSVTDWNTFNSKQNSLAADVDYLTPETASSTYQAVGDYLTGISAFTTNDLLQGSANLYSQWDTAANDIYYTAGKVGIGTTAPLNRLVVGLGAVNGQSIAL